MRKEACANISEMKSNILSFERFLFRSNEPIDIRKIMVDSSCYDCDYDAHVRKRNLGLINLLNDSMRLKNKKSECWSIINEIEDKLASPDFYRNMIFENSCPSFKDHIVSFIKNLRIEIGFLKKNLDEEEYEDLVESLADPDYPKTMDDFFHDLQESFLKNDLINNVA